MQIIRFEEKDIDAIFEIQRAAYKPLYEKYHDDETNPYMENKEVIFQKYTREGTLGYVFAQDDTIVGAVRIALFPESKGARVSALAVHPKYQGRGIAQKALSEIEKMHSSVAKWFLDTILEEEGNCHLYEKLGYVKTGKVEKINDKMTLVFYEKTR